MFSSDRRDKYGWGALRLALFTAFCFWHSSTAQRLFFELSPLRAAAHAYIGAGGALVNVGVLPLEANVGILVLAGVFMLLDLHHFGLANGDFAIAVYLAKTMGGDFFAGKLDTTEWRLALAFAFGCLAPAALYLGASWLAWARVFVSLFVVQLVCEYGDAHYEHLVFYRWRYSFELFTLLLLVLVPTPWEAHELRTIQIDVWICLWYRIGNVAILEARARADFLARALNMTLFRLLGWFTGVPIVRISSPELAVAVLKSSASKGNALEALIATPAWRPILSLESVEGEQWVRMRKSFDLLVKQLPAVSVLEEATARHAADLVRRGERIDAAAISLLTLRCFIEYVFGEPWRPEFDTFLAAAKEWRAEIAVRRRGDARLKQEAMSLLVDGLLRPSKKLWPLFGDKWCQPEYFSLIAQPFLISPVINVVDILCAVRLEQTRLDAPRPPALDACIRALHPFPVLERVVETDIAVDGHVRVAAGSHCIMFTQDFRASEAWPVFGSGPRSCAGTHLALPFLKILHRELCPLAQFDPLSGHVHSGRHNDGAFSGPAEALYFVSTVTRALLASRQSNK